MEPPTITLRREIVALAYTELHQARRQGVPSPAKQLIALARLALVAMTAARDLEAWERGLLEADELLKNEPKVPYRAA